MERHTARRPRMVKRPRMVRRGLPRRQLHTASRNTKQERVTNER